MLAGPISQQPWLTTNGSLIVLSALFVLTLGATIWVSFLKLRLKWRIAEQNAWIDRSVSIARERSRVLEIVSSNHKLDDLLTEICASAAHLLPGTECTYSFQPEEA